MTNSIFKITDFIDITMFDEGGEGCLFKATSSSGPVALKMYRTANFSNKREIEFLQNHPGHPNIVRLFGLVENNSKLVPGEWSGYVMEYMSCSLHDLIYDKSIIYELKQVHSWIHQVSSGLQFIHDRGYLHRDVKPKNILLGSSMNILKICDFGISKPYGQETLTVFIGSPHYMAPEIIEGQRSVTVYGTPAEVYSLAISINEIITRKKPFEHLGDMNGSQLFTAILQGLRPILFDKTIDEKLNDLVTRSLKINSEERPKVVDFIRHSAENMSNEEHTTADNIFENFKRRTEQCKLSMRQFQENRAQISKTLQNTMQGTFNIESLFLSLFDISDFNVKKSINNGYNSRIVEADSYIFGTVALKLYELGDVKMATSRYSIRLLSRLHHPNLIQTFGVVQETLPQITRIGLIMEHITGDSISLILDSQQPISLESKCSWMLQTSRAIAYLHSQNILHKNIAIEKLEYDFTLNRDYSILVDDTRKIAKLSGMVFVEQLDEDGNDTYNNSSITQNSSSSAKTFPYLEPEVFTKNSRRRASDIFLFAKAISKLFHMRTSGIVGGIQGFFEIGETSIFNIHVDPKICGEDVAEISKRGLNIDPKKRPTAVDLAKFFHAKLQMLSEKPLTLNGMAS